MVFHANRQCGNCDEYFFNGGGPELAAAYDKCPECGSIHFEKFDPPKVLP